MTILDVLEFDLMRKEAFQPPSKCLGNVKVIKARKRCECSSACGSSTGIPPKPGEVRAVSLTK